MTLKINFLPALVATLAIAEAYYHPVSLELEVIQRWGEVLYEKPKQEKAE